MALFVLRNELPINPDFARDDKRCHVQSLVDARKNDQPGNAVIHYDPPSGCLRVHFWPCRLHFGQDYIDCQLNNSVANVLQRGNHLQCNHNGFDADRNPLSFEVAGEFQRLEVPPDASQLKRPLKQMSSIPIIRQ